MSGESVRPPYPFLGLRRFEAVDGALYGGRDDDVALCVDQLRNPAVRVLVLQGLSGSGKSSFLRAGLMPRLEEEAPVDEADMGIVPVGCVFHAGPDLVEDMARQLHTFVMQGSGSVLWRRQLPRLAERFGRSEDFVDLTHDYPETLLEFLDELSDNPCFLPLIAIDQVEEYFTGPSATDIGARDQFLNIVREFADERFNGKLVLSLRTEQYGVFASRLPQSAQPAIASLRGVNRLYQHYLADPSREQLLDLATAPAAAYRFEFESGVANHIVDRLAQAAAAPEICVLPLLQTVMLRLYFCAVESAATHGGPVIITHAAFQAIWDRAGGSATALISDFVEWGLAEAVHQVLPEERGPQAQRMEVACWVEVLQRMSSRSGLGVRIRDPKRVVDIERVALDASCQADVASMVEALQGPRIGLLSLPDADYRFRLQHDLICLSFDLAPTIESNGFWVQAAKAKRRQILHAADYRMEDLFDDSDRPPTHRLRVSELRFWDHKSLAFAEHLGLFARLGLEVELVAHNEDISAEGLRTLLVQQQSAHALFSYPRSLMTPTEREASLDIVVLNAFAGYAIVCNSRAAEALPAYDEQGGWGRFGHICTAMLVLHAGGCKLVPEDDGACEFLLHMLDIHSATSVGGDEQAAIARLRQTATPSNKAGLELLDSLVKDEKEPWVAIVTTPTWALAMVEKRSIRPVIDQRALLTLLDDATANGRRPDLAALRRRLELRNAMNLCVVPGTPVDEVDALTMRLASVGLFVAECIWAQDREAGKWIRKRWSDTAAEGRGEQVLLPVFMGAFRRSCSYVTADDHGSRYFGTRWDDECPSALGLHHRWRRAQMDYERALADLPELQRRHGAEPDAAIGELVLRARCHAEIDNFHDASRLMAEALRRFGPALVAPPAAAPKGS